jgi:glycosyltransferase involved in cell wall biosynthesis
MRIAILTSQAFSLVNFRGPLIAALIGLDVEVLAMAPDYDAVSRLAVHQLGATPVDISLSRSGINPLRDGLDCWRLMLKLRRLKVDATLCYFIKPVIFGTVAAALAKVPKRYCMIEGLGYVFTPTGGEYSIWRKVLRWLVLQLYKFSLQFADNVFLLNEDDIRDLVKWRTLTATQVVKLDGIGVDLEEWSPIASVTHPVTFLLAARLLREKGISDYAAAAALVKKKYPASRFILLGGVDPNPGSLDTSEVAAWVDQGILEWPGHVPVKAWLAQASVFVLPSYYREGLPRSTQEAMAMGRAVITTDVPGCRETVIDGGNGYLVPVRDPQALANAMIRFIEAPELVTSMGRASRELAVKRFDVHKVNATMMAAMGITNAP